MSRLRQKPEGTLLHISDQQMQPYSHTSPGTTTNIQLDTKKSTDRKAKVNQTGDEIKPPQSKH